MKKAYTLIELLIVIAMMGIILALIIPPIKLLLNKHGKKPIPSIMLQTSKPSETTVPIEQTNLNSEEDAHVTLIMEYNGIKVYRFLDPKTKQWVYFQEGYGKYGR